MLYANAQSLNARWDNAVNYVSDFCASAEEWTDIRYPWGAKCSPVVLQGAPLYGMKPCHRLAVPRGDRQPTPRHLPTREQVEPAGASCVGNGFTCHTCHRSRPVPHIHQHKQHTVGVNNPIAGKHAHIWYAHKHTGLHSHTHMQSKHMRIHLNGHK